jgi:subtilase family protein
VLAAVALAALLATAAPQASSYAPPPGGWARFQSDLNAAEGLATGRGVTIALLSTGADPTVPGLAGKVTVGPDYIFSPRIATADMLGTLTAALIAGEPGVVQGAAPAARILALRTEPDYFEPGYSGFFSGPHDTDTQPVNAAAIRYAVSHGARVILVDSDSYAPANPALLSAVSYALSKNAVIVAPEPSTSPKWSWEYQYPSGLPGVIGVSAVMLPGGQPPFSSFTAQRNNSVLISGPADTVVASGTGWQLDDFATAAAFTAATVALIKERYPALPPELVARALAMSARYHPAGGYAPSAGFGVLDPYDAILDAGRLAAAGAGGAGAGGAGAVAPGARFGGEPPPGVISALPPAGPVTGLYWALLAAGALLLVTIVALGWRVSSQQLPKPE